MRVISPGFGLGLANYGPTRILDAGACGSGDVYPVRAAVFLFSCPMLPAGHPVCPEEKFSPVCELPVDIRVLVIDDNSIQLESSVECFPAVRFTVTAARMSGADGLSEQTGIRPSADRHTDARCE